MKAKAFALAVLLTVTAACSQQSAESPMVANVTPDQLRALAEQRIVFAHQSVGNDVLGGLAALAKQTDVNLNIVETRTPPQSGPGIYHFQVGTNGDPSGKMQEFVRHLSGSDVAMLKLCYIDFAENTDAQALAQQYIKTLEQAQQAHPKTRIVALTAPLTTVQTGPKAWIKRLLGKSPAGFVANAKRQTFNDALRKHFPSDQLFDIAQVQSTNGEARYTFEHDGRLIESLNPAITSDGGHLNDAGKATVASALIGFLAKR